MTHYPLIPEELTVRIGPLVNLAPLVESFGRDPGPDFSACGLSIKDFRDPDHRVSYLTASRLLARCATGTGCDHLGLLLGQRAEPSSLGIAGFLLRTASTAGEGLQALVDNLDLHGESESITLEVGSDFTRLAHTVHVPGIKASDQIGDLAAVIMYKIMQSLCGPGWNAATVELKRSVPKDSSPYRNFFKTAVHFNATECAITFSSQHLNAVSPTADKLLFEHLKEESRYLHRLHHSEMLDLLPAAMTHGLLTERYSAGDIADQFGIHERTLHRRLQAASTTFRQELDKARQSIGEQLLVSTSLTVGEVASALGYSDSSGFIRAFQRWNGVSPSNWRRNYGPQYSRKKMARQ